MTQKWYIDDQLRIVNVAGLCLAHRRYAEESAGDEICLMNCGGYPKYKWRFGQ